MMGILDYFRPKVTPASIAKERLQIIVAHERKERGKAAEYLPSLKEDILKVIRKYVEIAPEQVKVQVDTHDKNCTILELDIELPVANSKK